MAEKNNSVEESQMFTKTDWNFMVVGLILTAVVWFMGVGLIFWLLE